MPKVNINGHDHQVEIDGGDSPLEDVVTAARQLWRDTLEAPQRPGPASAGASTERRNHGTSFTWYLGAGEQLPVAEHGDRA